VGMFIACNPNNPTGTAIHVEEMRTILEHCKKIGASVMIDETYIEFSDILDDICSIPLVKEFDNLFVIRGTSKFFAAPGIRLGYGMSSNQAFLDRFKTNSDPWSVNSLADFIGQHIFTDFEFHKKTQKLVSEERRKAFAELSTWKNIKAYPSEANFILLKLKTDKVTAHDLFEKCIMKKMLIRDASSFTFLDESFLRFCILSPENNAALLKELKSIVEE
ncbi:MAG: aminotransferase class I/II-fold pyridoxal phosphate-dependent enzyme, partial [Anaerotignum sp.]|nr:aminotransferase class I/II-fold pyridoxal phosphate-dependent enzyme [Anaerotignum sp.]